MTVYGVSSFWIWKRRKQVHVFRWKILSCRITDFAWQIALDFLLVFHWNWRLCLEELWLRGHVYYTRSNIIYDVVEQFVSHPWFCAGNPRGPSFKWKPLRSTVCLLCCGKVFVTFSRVCGRGNLRVWLFIKWRLLVFSCRLLHRDKAY